MIREVLRSGKTIYDLPLRVVYYARVSTDKDDQLNSLENQQHYFEEMINENKNWQFSGSYIDEGISGTAVKHRNSFLKMIEDATFGKIDLILTKEISRFSRNTVDSIKYTEYLLKNGVIVYFLSDNLNTIQEDAEFRLTIMSSLAQDEVRKLSERVKFGINRMIKERKLIGGNLTGYYKKNGRYEINPKESPIITYLFKTYVSGNISLKKIGLNLAKMGYLNSKGKPYSQTTLAKFLTNPRYKGYYTARLTEVEDYKTHKKRKIPLSDQIIEKDHRIPILVSEEIWNQANQLYLKRKHKSARHILNSNKSLTTSKYSCLISCQHCGHIFIRTGGGNRRNNPTWVCQTYKHHGVTTCSSPIIPEKYLDEIFINIFTNLLKPRPEFLNLILKEYNTIIKNYHVSSELPNINTQINLLEKKLDKLLDLSLQGIINDFEFKKYHDKLNHEINNLKLTINNINQSNLTTNQHKILISKLNHALVSKLNINTELPHLLRLFINKITVKKINNSRQHLKIHIYFNFQTKPITKELTIPSRHSKNSLFISKKS